MADSMASITNEKFLKLNGAFRCILLISKWIEVRALAWVFQKDTNTNLIFGVLAAIMFFIEYVWSSGNIELSKVLRIFANKVFGFNALKNWSLSHNFHFVNVKK